MAKCISCNARKGKRNCPALAASICSLCCGTKKGSEFQCPSDCFYFATSKEYFSEREETKQLREFGQELKSIIGNENAHMDVLQNIEYIIQQAYKQNCSITDQDVALALEYLLEMGKAQMEIPSKFLTKIPSNAQTIADAVDDILEFRASIAQKETFLTKLKC